MDKQTILNFITELNKSNKSPNEVIDIALTTCLSLLVTNEEQEKFREIVKTGSIVDVVAFGCQISPNYLDLLTEKINE